MNELMPDEYEWDASGDHMTALGSAIRLRAADRWELHSWNLFEDIEGGGRISPYRVQKFYAVWKRIKA